MARGAAQRMQPRADRWASSSSKATTRSIRRARAMRAIATAFATTTRACCRACSISTRAGGRRRRRAAPVPRRRRTFDVVPEGGTFVAFLSADFEHEVLPRDARAHRAHRMVSASRLRARAVRMPLSLACYVIISVPAPRRLTIATRESRLPCGRRSRSVRASRRSIPVCARVARRARAGDRTVAQRVGDASGNGCIKDLEAAMAEAAPISRCIRSRTCRRKCRPDSPLRRITAREDPRDAFVSHPLRASLANARPARWSARRACAARRSCASAGPRSRSRRCAATSTRGCACSTRDAATRSSSPRLA